MPHSGQSPSSQPPTGQPAVRVIPMPADTNGNGDIFGGWLVSQMDMGAGMVASRRARGRVATVAIDSMVFHMPVKVGDEVSVYCEITRVGRTSMTVVTEVWRQHDDEPPCKVTEAVFTFVAIDDNGRPRPVATPPAQTPPVSQE